MSDMSNRICVCVCVWLLCKQRQSQAFQLKTRLPAAWFCLCLHQKESQGSSYLLWVYESYMHLTRLSHILKSYKSLLVIDINMRRSFRVKRLPIQSSTAVIEVSCHWIGQNTKRSNGGTKHGGTPAMDRDCPVAEPPVWSDVAEAPNLSRLLTDGEHVLWEIRMTQWWHEGKKRKERRKSAFQRMPLQLNEQRKSFQLYRAWLRWPVWGTWGC